MKNNEQKSDCDSNFKNTTADSFDSTANVEVYCRLKPCAENEEEKCIKLNNETSLNILTPASKISGGIRQQITCAFKKILLPDCCQKEVFDNIANDMVTNLIRGKNGLLFTYGITGSGKTYTLGGTSGDPGILPRCVTSVYNSIKENLAPTGYIRLDKNGQVELAVENKSGLSTPKVNRKNTTFCETPACLKKCGVPIDCDKNLMFAIFISMIEIYNNNIYDLFEDHIEQTQNNKPPQAKNLRENSTRGIFIPGLAYVPVNSVSEALTFYRKGKKRRKIAETLLNSTSSRSHCVFTLYLVQIERGNDNGYRSGVVSQLSLCDLAGSERMYRTQNEGERQKESSSINSSLMILRNCIEALRENQRLDTKSRNQLRLVPYRESRLTLMFRNFFEGDGNVRMILCLNPIPGDFEENLHVARFAEVTQEIKIKIDHPRKNKEFKLDSITPLLNSYDDKKALPALISYLQECDRLRTNMSKELLCMGESLFKEISRIVTENQMLKDKYDSNRGKYEDFERESSQLRHSLKIAKGKIGSLEEQLKNVSTENLALKSDKESLNQKFINERSARRILKRKLHESQALQVDKLERECNKRVYEATEEMKNKLYKHDQCLKVVKGVLHNTTCLPPMSDVSNLHSRRTSLKNDKILRKRKSSSDDNSHKN
ncbi:hypothetical protein HZS_714, partial [Henneguya salminicola]